VFRPLLIILDTNVLVSGLLKGNSNPGLIMRLIVNGRLRLAYDFRIIDEYREVLIRPKFKFRRENIDSILKVIETEGVLMQTKPIDITLEDPGDRPFIEVAAACKGAPLVTGNLKHYKACKDFDVELVTPAELISRL
jgi:uncharacterized protein